MLYIHDTNQLKYMQQKIYLKQKIHNTIVMEDSLYI